MNHEAQERLDYVLELVDDLKSAVQADQPGFREVRRILDNITDAAEEFLRSRARVFTVCREDFPVMDFTEDPSFLTDEEGAAKQASAFVADELEEDGYLLADFEYCRQFGDHVSAIDAEDIRWHFEVGLEIALENANFGDEIEVGNCSVTVEEVDATDLS